MSLASIANRNATYYEILPTLSTSKQMILRELQRLGEHGATRHELAKLTGLPLSSVCGRIADLEAARMVDSTHRVRDTEYGKSATVVVLVPGLVDSRLVQKELF